VPQRVYRRLSPPLVAATLASYAHELCLNLEGHLESGYLGCLSRCQQRQLLPVLIPWQVDLVHLGDFPLVSVDPGAWVASLLWLELIRWLTSLCSYFFGPLASWICSGQLSVNVCFHSWILWCEQLVYLPHLSLWFRPPTSWAHIMY